MKNKPTKQKLIALLIFFSISTLLFVPSAYSDTVHLKSGEEINGRITGQGEDFILIETDSGDDRILKPSEVERYEMDQAAPAPRTAPSAVAASNRSTAPEKNSGSVTVAINPMIELDYRTKESIYQLRKQYVMRHPELLEGGPYEPSEAVYGQIVGKKPWWGILGHSHYGNTENSIAGPSEESRFIANPFLFVALDEPNAHIVGDPRLKPKAVYPRPSRLVWKKDRTEATATYLISEFKRDRMNYHTWDANEAVPLLIGAANAHDFGFNFLFVVPERSKGVTFPQPAAAPIANTYMYHLGGSCGHPEMCNNKSPRIPELEFQVMRLPAFVSVKLWRDQPVNADAPPDMIFNIEMV